MDRAPTRNHDPRERSSLTTAEIDLTANYDILFQNSKYTYLVSIKSNL